MGEKRQGEEGRVILEWYVEGWGGGGGVTVVNNKISGG